jgi:cellulose synthase operon protein YhjQ
MQIIAFISGKGGVGKTTLAANVGAALGLRKKRVLLIDLDPQNALRLHLGMDPDEIAGLVREGIGPDSVFDSPFGVKFIPFGRVAERELAEFEAALAAHPAWVADGLETLKPHFDFILLDTPPGPTEFLRQALGAAHRALAVLLADAASFATAGPIESLVEQYTAGRADFTGMHFLINQMPAHSKLGHQVREMLQASYGARVVPAAVHKDGWVPQALAFERPVLQYEPGCRASLDVQYVADWILDSAER